ncbi:MAG: TetR/AcrR family transcriptional regulator [Ilumatobacteraceae bacterium]
MSMSISYVHGGRQDQKQRTRQALITAARDLLARGATPTVEAAAAAASISRATAYRYFPNQHSLLVGAHPEVDAASLLDADDPLDPEARLDLVITRSAELLFRAEATYRTTLRLSLEADPAAQGDLVLRRGLRLRWIEDALEPVRDQLPSADFRYLVHAIAVVIWIEAIIVLVDLAGLSRAEAVEVVRWSARSLLRSALADRSGTSAT